MFASDIEARIIHGSILDRHTLEGRVEVNYDGEWRSLCNGNWDDNDLDNMIMAVKHSSSVRIFSFPLSKVSK